MTDYTKFPLKFRILKVLKYLRLFGFSRTLNKVRAAYHMKRTYSSLPVTKANNSKAHVGIVGCGNFAFSTISYYLKKNFGHVIRGVMDIDQNKAASLCENYGANYYTDNIDRIIADDDIDLVYIASNHATHAEYAIQALKAGKSVHIEKPPVVSDDQLERLCSAMRNSSGNVGLGYNRPQSPIGRKIQAAIDSQSGPMMINWFIAAHALEDNHWYFSPAEGGRVLGNLCHWIDYTLSLIPEESRFPVKITPASSRECQSDFVVSYEFADASLAVITMSSKGHTFEGVAEKLNVHRGNVLLTMSDFKVLTVKIDHHSSNQSGFYRDHGHEGAITQSYKMRAQKPCAQSRTAMVRLIWESANLILRTKDAIENCKQVTALGYQLAADERT